MENMIVELSKLYETTTFQKSYRDGNEVLIYDNADLEWDEHFISVVISLAEKYLTPEKLISFTFLYDYLDELSLTEVEPIFGVNYIENQYVDPFNKKLSLDGKMLNIELRINIKETTPINNFKNFIFKSNSKQVLKIASQF